LFLPFGKSCGGGADEFCSLKKTVMQNTTNALAGKRVLILGGSTGIGLATAKAAAQRGAMVTIVSSNEAKLQQALQQLPPGAKTHQLDLSSEEAIKAFFEAGEPIDHLVYTAGENLQLGQVDTLSIEVAKSFWQIRYWGALAAVKYATPHLSKSGSVVLTGGASGVRTGKGWAMGTSICCAMEGLTKVLALELAPARVNIVAPGIVKTALWGNMSEADQEAMYAHSAATLPVQYVASPEEIALTYIHLMQQPYITGQQVVVDGGYALG
jgi:NAD(P)-dependent dehydrogenase (short-subunit alcohol dehydrogenase family)